MGFDTFFHLSSTVLTFRVDIATMLGLQDVLHRCVHGAGSSGLPRMHAVCVMLRVCIAVAGVTLLMQANINPVQGLDALSASEGLFSNKGVRCRP